LRQVEPAGSDEQFSTANQIYTSGFSEPFNVRLRCCLQEVRCNLGRKTGADDLTAAATSKANFRNFPPLTILNWYCIPAMQNKYALNQLVKRASLVS